MCGRVSCNLKLKILFFVDIIQRTNTSRSYNIKSKQEPLAKVAFTVEAAYCDRFQPDNITRMITKTESTEHIKINL